jgi:hypothetical protein
MQIVSSNFIPFNMAISREKKCFVTYIITFFFEFFICKNKAD